MRINKPLLLAPAGSWTMLNAVIDRGADAVYFGIQDFNMRAQSENFTIDEIHEVVTLCHERKVQAHLTLNTILFDEELEKAAAIIRTAKTEGVDEIICWDPGVIQLCIEHQMPFCISTQASVANSAAARFYHKLGAKRVVLARECSLEKIKEIINQVDIEVEAFIHGAMCIAVSGRCFLSHELFGRSANRGDCIQPCRREYQIYDERKDYSLTMGNDYVLSSKDLCSIDFLDQLIKAGIHVFKIEGRKRSPEYAAAVTEVYRAAIDAYFENALTTERKSELTERLNDVFNRGFTSGFYHADPDGKDFATEEGNIAAIRKEYRGEVLNYYKNSMAAFIRLKGGTLSKGDKVLIIGKTSGVVELEIETMRVNDIEKEFAGKGDTITFLCHQRVRAGDKLYVLKDADNTQLK